MYIIYCHKNKMYKEQNKTNRNNLSKPEALSIRKHNQAFFFIFIFIVIF